jgi:hypothetical protein
VFHWGTAFRIFYTITMLLTTKTPSYHLIQLIIYFKDILMGPKREERRELIEDPQEVILPTDEVQVREHDGDDYYESPIDLDGYYNDQMELRD